MEISPSMSMKNLLKKDFNDNDKSMKGRPSRRARVLKTEAIADKLVKTFDAPQSRNFFLKCAWHLSEAQIWELAERAKAPAIKSSVKYFVASCSQQMSLRG